MRRCFPQSQRHVRQTGSRRNNIEPSHISVPSSLRRRLSHDNPFAQRKGNGRLGRRDEQLAVLRRPRKAAALPRTDYYLQSHCLVCHQRRRRLRRYLRALPISWLHKRVLFLKILEYAQSRRVCSRKKLRPSRNGGHNERGDARATHEHIPHCRTHGRVFPFRPADDCVACVIPGDNYL